MKRKCMENGVWRVMPMTTTTTSVVVITLYHFKPHTILALRKQKHVHVLNEQNVE